MILAVAMALSGCHDEKKKISLKVAVQDEVEAFDEMEDDSESWSAKPEEESSEKPSSVSDALTDEEKTCVADVAYRTDIPSFQPIFDRCRQTYREHRRGRRPADVSALPEYKQLCAMGPAILPLVVQELTKPGNLFALKLYDDLQTNASLKIKPAECRDTRERAVRTVRLWVKSCMGEVHPVPAS